MNGFTDKEKEIMKKIVEVHNLYADLESQHPNDLPDWVNSIHNLQRIMGMRVLRREHPNEFISFKPDK